jgi:hypothetical protein
MMTGMPSKSFTTSDYTDQEMWDNVKDWDSRKFVMAAGTSVSQYGLTAGHAYSLISAHELNGNKVFKMRNPWSSEKYNGPWNDEDSRWTPALRA